MLMGSLSASPVPDSEVWRKWFLCNRLKEMTSASGGAHRPVPNSFGDTDRYGRTLPRVRSGTSKALARNLPDPRSTIVPREKGYALAGIPLPDPLL
jgi:hypothetical protein